MIDADGSVVHQVDVSLSPAEVFEYRSGVATTAGLEPAQYPPEGRP
jgi:hypothetical protein